MCIGSFFQHRGLGAALGASRNAQKWEASAVTEAKAALLDISIASEHYQDRTPPFRVNIAYNT